MAFGSVCSIAAAAIKGTTFEALNGGRHRVHGCRSDVGLYEQAEDMKRGGPGA
jgi:hypothetical protein